jgi:DNA-binding NarL/FixJ family response regulator
MSARVLVVSQNPLALEGISQALRLHLPATIVETASTACDALILVATRHFEAIVFPACLPDRNGLNFLKQVKTLRPESTMFFVGDPDDRNLREEALRLGAHAFIDQPLVIDRFIPLLREAVTDALLRGTPMESDHQPV